MGEFRELVLVGHGQQRRVLGHALCGVSGVVLALEPGAEWLRCLWSGPFSMDPGHPFARNAAAPTHHPVDSTVVARGAARPSSLMIPPKIHPLKPLDSRQLQSSREVQLALALYSSFQSGAWGRFFRLLRGAPYLFCCAAFVHFNLARGKALQALVATASAAGASRGRSFVCVGEARAGLGVDECGAGLRWGAV